MKFEIFGRLLQTPKGAKEAKIWKKRKISNFCCPRSSQKYIFFKFHTLTQIKDLSIKTCHKPIYRLFLAIFKLIFFYFFNHFSGVRWPSRAAFQLLGIRRQVKTHLIILIIGLQLSKQNLSKQNYENKSKQNYKNMMPLIRRKYTCFIYWEEMDKGFSIPNK